MNPEEIAQSITHGNMPYHSVPEVGIEGRRDNEHRLKRLNLPDVTGKNVVDIGCNSGFFCRWAIDNGASWVSGVDLIDTVTAARSLCEPKSRYARLLMTGLDLRNAGAKSIGRCDVMFFFSMFKILGMPHFLSRAEHVIIENNNTRFEDYIQWRLDRLGFTRIEHCGYTEDFGKRSIIKGWK